jgi:hypothetical protein
MVANSIHAAAIRLAYAGVGTVALAVRPAAAAAALARRGEAGARRGMADGFGRATLALLDGALASPYADDAVQHVLDSGLAERAVARAMSGELVDVVARDVVRYEVIERLTDQVLESDALDRALDRADLAGVPQRVADRLLTDGVVEGLAERFVDGPELTRIVDHALVSQGIDQMVTRIVESRVVRDAIARVADDTAVRLRESEAMWTLIDDIAQSPAVLDAITQQGAGFADQLGGEVRERSRNVDARLEGAARRLLRRRPAQSAGPAPSAPGAA